MADVLTDDPACPRKHEQCYVYLTSGYYPMAKDLVALIAEGLKQVPEEYRDGVWVTIPDEDTSEWNLAYDIPESDESYAARLKKHQRETARYHNKALSELQLAKKELDEAITTRDRRKATHTYEYKLRVAKEYGIDTTTYE